MRLCRIFLDLAPDVCHVYAQDLVAALALGTPEFLHYEVIGQDLARTFSEQRDDTVLILREVAVFAVYKHLMLIIVYRKIAGSELAGICQSLVGDACPGVPYGDADPRKQFPGAERLGNISRSL